MWAYRETLCDLSVDELEYGCMEAMKEVRFTPTPAEIREHAFVLRKSLRQVPALNALPAAPPMSAEESTEFFAKLKAEVPMFSEVPGLTQKPLQPDGIVIITDEMRARARRKAKEAAEKFGKSA